MTKVDSNRKTGTVPAGCESDEFDSSIAKGGVTTPFPWKLHDMLDAMDEEGTQNIVCWQPHGRSFMVHKPKEFVNDIMTDYFNQTKYASFQRQLNLYGFSRLSHGRDKGAYYHPCFVRGERNLCRGMVRQKIKGTKVRRSLSPEEEPNFYLLEYNTKLLDQRPPTPVKKQVRAPRRAPTPSPVKSTMKPTPEQSNSLVSLMKSKSERGPVTTILPPPPMIRPLQIPRIVTGAPPCPLAPPKPCPIVRGGDLLFFEGLPFRYLEHIEELPPPPPSLSPVYQTHYKESLNDMIKSIVGMETSWAEPRRTPCCI